MDTTAQIEQLKQQVLQQQTPQQIPQQVQEVQENKAIKKLNKTIEQAVLDKIAQKKYLFDSNIQALLDQIQLRSDYIKQKLQLDPFHHSFDFLQQKVFEIEYTICNQFQQYYDTPQLIIAKNYLQFNNNKERKYRIIQIYKVDTDFPINLF